MDDLISREEATSIPILPKEHRKIFKSIDDAFETGWNEALSCVNMLPSAQPHWIPVTERLPEEDTEVIVSCIDDSGDSEFSYTTTGWHYKGIWVVDNVRSFFVKAWTPLPEPYKGEQG